MTSKDPLLVRLKGTRPVRAIGRRLVDALDARERNRPVLPHKSTGAWSLTGSRLLDALPESERAAWLAEGSAHDYARRRTILLDEADARVWLVVSGGVKLCRVGIAGTRTVEAILAPGDVFGRLCGHAPDVQYEVQALEPTRVLSLARDRFERTLRTHPELAITVVQVLEDRQRALVRRLEALVFKDVRARLAETLLDLTREHGDPCPHGFAVDVRITQQDLAELVGASRQMVNRVLGDLSRSLYVARMGRVICVLHRERLERLASEPMSTG